MKKIILLFLFSLLVINFMSCKSNGTDNDDDSDPVLLAYMTSILSVRIYDVTNPASPAEVGSVYVANSARGIAVKGNYAYVTNYNEATFIAIDATDYENPIIAGSCNLPDLGYRIEISGNYAYVACTYSGLQIINISSPGAPVLVGGYDTPNYCTGIDVVGDYAYLAEDEAFRIIDISDKSAPSEVGVWTGVGSLGSLNSVVVAGDYAYVSDIDHTVRAFDINDPESPEMAGSETVGGGPVDVYMSGGILYMVDWADTWVNGGIHAFSVDGYNLYEMGDYTPARFSANNLVVIGNYAYISSAVGFIIIDISNTASMSEVVFLEPDYGFNDIALQSR